MFGGRRKEGESGREKFLSKKKGERGQRKGEEERVEGETWERARGSETKIRHKDKTKEHGVTGVRSGLLHGGKMDRCSKVAESRKINTGTILEHGQPWGCTTDTKTPTRSQYDKHERDSPWGSWLALCPWGSNPAVPRTCTELQEIRANDLGEVTEAHEVIQGGSSAEIALTQEAEGLPSLCDLSPPLWTSNSVSLRLMQAFQNNNNKKLYLKLEAELKRFWQNCMYNVIFCYIIFPVSSAGDLEVGRNSIKKEQHLVSLSFSLTVQNFQKWR